MSEKLVEKLFEYAGRFIVSLEVPPGVGKTYYATKHALEIASRGRVVILALPNHQALATAFAYAVKHYVELMKRKPMKKLPYLVYYEGIARFCPYFKKNGEKIFKKMLEKLLKEKKIDQAMYDRLKDLGVMDIVRIYTSMFLCKYLCPVYKLQKYFEKEKIFITPTIANQSTVSKLYTSEAEKTKVIAMLSNLNQLKSQGLVAEIEPRMDENGNVDGYCIRAILSKALTKRRTQLVMKGVLILTPIHALDFVAQTVAQRINILRKRGLPLPPPLIIIDEYDFYIYKSVDLPLFLLDQLRIEKELAKRVFTEEREKRFNGDPDYDWEKLVAALIAYKVLSELENEANDFLNRYRREPGVDLLESPVNIFADCASKPLKIEDKVYPPFSPRIVRLGEFKKLLVDIYTWLEEVNEYAIENFGISLYDVKTVKSLGLKHFLRLWENILYLIYRREQRRYLQPALYRSLGEVYRIGYVESETPISIARKFVEVLASTDTLALFYKIVKVDAPVKRNGRTVSEKGGYLLFGVYDYKLFKIFRSSNYDIVLMSATGVPWLSNIFATRSQGFGAVIPFYRLRYAASKEISNVFKDVRSKVGMKKEFSYIVLESDQFAKKMLIIMLDVDSLYTYASHASICPIRDLPMMPMSPLKNYNYYQYIIELSKAVEPYVTVSINFMDAVLKSRVANIGVPSLLTLTQRKDVAIMYTYLLYVKLTQQRTNVTVMKCKGNRCYEVKDKDLTLEKMMSLEEGLSHYVVFAKTGRGEFRFYITWLRSKMSRGIDLPDDAVAYGVMMVGTPYRPPEAFDILPKEASEYETVRRATYIEYPMYIENYDYRNLVVFVHNPIDVAEAVNEFIQAVGRALRRAWNISISHGKMMYRVLVIIPRFAVNKIFTYSPLWFQTAFSW